MVKAGIDQDALIQLLAQARARQGTAVRKAVFTATLQALRGRELTLENIRRVLKAATVASSTGAAHNTGSPAQVQGLLAQAVAGMDEALLQAVEAHRTALQQFMDLGVGPQDSRMADTLEHLARLEQVFIGAVGKAVEGAAQSVQAPWQTILGDMQQQGTSAGQMATQVVAQLMEQSHTALRHGRAASLRAAQAMMESYGALASGVLMGLSEAVLQGRAAPTPPRGKPHA